MYDTVEFITLAASERQMEMRRIASLRHAARTATSDTGARSFRLPRLRRQRTDSTAPAFTRRRRLAAPVEFGLQS